MTMYHPNNNSGDQVEEEGPSLQPPIDTESWCRTKITDDVKHTFAWSIEKFSERTEVNSQFLWSSKFTIKGPDDQVTSWKMKLYPKGDTPEATGFVSVYLSNQTDTEVKARYEFTILDASKNKQNKVKSNFTQFKAKPDSWGFRKFVGYEFLKSRAHQFLPNDTLTVVCDVSIVGQEVIVSSSKYHEEKVGKPRNKCHKQLSVDLDTAFKSQDYSDVTVICGGQEFKCHQFMLSARSPVFRAMFQSDMTEAATRKVDIEDLPSDVIYDMLLYIYTGSTPNISKKPGDLLAAADKYQLEQLKLLCEDEMCSSLEMDNAVEYMILGDVYQAHKLKRLAMQLVVRNMTVLVRSKDWKGPLMRYPTLMAEVLEEMAKKDLGEPPAKRIKVSGTKSAKTQTRHTSDD